MKFSVFWVVALKFTKFLLSCWKPKLSFSLNFGFLFSVMRDNSSVFFELYMIWTKGAHQGAKFQTLDCSLEISPNLYFDRLFLLKVYKELCFMKLKSDAKKPRFCCFKNDKNLVNFDPSTRKSPKFALLLVPFCAKYMMFEWKCQHWEFDRILLRKVENAWTKNLQRSYVITLKNDAKCLGEIDLPFQNWHEEFDKFWPKHSKV